MPVTHPKRSQQVTENLPDRGYHPSGIQEGQILKERGPVKAVLRDLVHSKTRGLYPMFLAQLVLSHCSDLWYPVSLGVGGWLWQPAMDLVALLYGINPFHTTAVDVCFLEGRRECVTHLCCVSCIKSRPCCLKSILCSVCHSSICLLKSFVKC